MDLSTPTPTPTSVADGGEPSRTQTNTDQLRDGRVERLTLELLDDHERAVSADRAVIDLMLTHVPKDKVEAAYNRAAHLDRWRELAQLWADLIMEGRPAAAELLSGR